MNIAQLKKEITKYHIEENCCLIEPEMCIEGALCIIRDNNENGWRIILNERGNYIHNEFFYSEHDACIFFLKLIFEEPTYHKMFKGKNYAEFLIYLEKIAKENGFV